MATGIISALLAVVTWVFQYVLPSKADAQKRAAELLTKWMVRMDKWFQASPIMSEAAETIWGEYEKEEWKETGIEPEETQKPVTMEHKE
jgi:hypothetical protein